jgi:hypothetical protein
MLGSVPTLDEIAREPLRALALGPEQAVALIAQCGAAQAALMAGLARTAPSESQDDHLLTVEQAAAKLAVTPEWLYRRAKRLRLATKLGDGTLRFSNAVLEKYIKQNTASSVTSGRRRTAVAV